MQDYWMNPPIPASTFLTTWINYCLIIVAVRCIWTAFKALDTSSREWYLASYRIFIVVLLGTLLFNVLPSMLSILRIFLTQASQVTKVAQCTQNEFGRSVLVLPFACGSRNVLVLPFENAAPIIALIITALTVLAFLLPKPISELLSRLWGWKRFLLIAIACLIAGALAIAFGYPIMCCQDGTVPQQFGLFLDSEFHQRYGDDLMAIGWFSILIGLLFLALPLRDSGRKVEEAPHEEEPHPSSALRASLTFRSDGMPQLVATVRYPNGQETDECFIVDTGSPKTFLTRKTLSFKDISIDGLPDGQPFGATGRPEVKTKKLQNLAITVHYADNSPKIIETDVLVFMDMHLVDNLLGMDLIQRIGTLVVAPTDAWFEDR
jgi:hypothetical protein